MSTKIVFAGDTGVYRAGDVFQKMLNRAKEKDQKFVTLVTFYAKEDFKIIKEKRDENNKR